MFYDRLLWYRYNKFSPAFAYRWITSATRSLPHFLIIGAQKCGTTSLYSYLVQHPKVISANKKEVKYFDMFHQQSLGWYRSHFPTQSQLQSAGAITGEATPDYLFFEESAQRVHDVVPNAKLIVLLRDPADRSYSQYRYSSRRGYETLSFADALAAEPQRLDDARNDAKKRGESITSHREFREYSYTLRSDYASQLDAWFKLFDRSQFLFLSTTDLQTQAQKVLDQTTDFLELERHTFTFSERLNSAPSTPSEEATRQIQQLRQSFQPEMQRLHAMTGLHFEPEVVAS
ncbi:MAG: sulfotransferase domain-containing protein [Planctomycetota bacterium]